MKKLFVNMWSWVRPYLTVQMIPFLVIAWFITNGWSYVLVVVGTKYGIPWMTWVGTAWISFLWFPGTVEKPITLFIAGLLYRIIYRKPFKKKEGVVEDEVHD